MYWISSLHHQNYQTLALRFPAVRTSKEYAAGCYLVAHPEIFKKVDWSICEGPIDWLFEDYTDRKGNVDLSSGIQFLAKVAVSLYGGHEEVNISDVTKLDEDNYQVFLQSIAIRVGREVTTV